MAAEEPVEKLRHYFSICIQTCRVLTGIRVVNKAFGASASMVKTHTGPAWRGALCDAPTPGFSHERALWSFILEMKEERDLRG